MLRGKFDQVEKSSGHSGAIKNAHVAPLASPASFDPRASFMIGSAPVAAESVPLLEEFGKDGDPRFFGEYQARVLGSSWSQPPGLTPPTGPPNYVDREATYGQFEIPMAKARAIVPPPLPKFFAVGLEPGWVPRLQSFRQFRQSIQDSGVRG